MIDNPHLQGLDRVHRTVVSFPKSGRTWLRYAAGLEGLAPDFSHAGHPSAADMIGVPWVGIPEDLRGQRIIFLHRDPIDTAISYYFQLIKKDCVPGRKTWRAAQNTHRPMPPVDIDQFVLDPHYGVEFISTFNRGWLDYMATHKHAMAVLSYEDLVHDPAHNFQKFFTALGHPDVDIGRIVEETTFAKMKALQDTPKGLAWRMRTFKKKEPESAKIRKGKIGGYHDYLKPRTIKLARKIALQHGFEPA